MPIDFGKELNAQQREAVHHVTGPLLVLAGAGSGKTRVLTYRIAYLTLQGFAAEEEILAVTFTNKAAFEMKERVKKIVSKSAIGSWVSTFHAFGLGILKCEGIHIGLEKDFVVYGEKEQKTLIKRTLEQLNIGERWLTPEKAHSRICLYKRELVSPKEALTSAVGPLEERSALTYEKYQANLLSSNAVDFDDLLFHVVTLWREHEQVRKHYAHRFPFILVDEYQDTNKSQYELLRLLCKDSQNIFVVGDEDQSIYSWRGANIRNILEFERDFPGTRVIKLEQNYRSTQHILNAANAVIGRNRERLGKHLWTAKGVGLPIECFYLRDEKAEARTVVQQILKLQTEGFCLNDFAVFYRTNSQSRVIEDHLRQNNIPYQIYGGLRFYDRAEIRDCLAYMRLLVNKRDQMSVLRILNVPRRGIGKTTIARLEELAASKHIPLLQAIQTAMEDTTLLNAGARKRLSAFCALIAELQQFSQELPLSSLFKQIIEKTGYGKSLKSLETIEAEARLENIAELENVICEFERESAENLSPQEKLQEFLDRISLITDIDRHHPEIETISLMTLHMAKGLEFPAVFITGLEEGLFPHAASEWSREELEEERRLCYVGMTRAKERLFLSAAQWRHFRGEPHFMTPSRFLEELPKDHAQFQNRSRF